MPSQALQTLERALHEIPELAAFTQTSSRRSRADALRLARVLGRGQVVLLSSHFERYIYSVNEEAVLHLNTSALPSERIPEGIRLLHSAQVINDLGAAQWDNRGISLTQFVETDAWLWRERDVGALLPPRLLAWMKAPHSRNLIRYYRYWEIGDIFSSITRTSTQRSLLFLGIQELVDKRNDIAHGDFNAQATRLDVLRYLKTVRTFCARADRVLSKAVRRIAGAGAPW